MYLTKVECRTFRCLSQVSFEPLQGVNIIRGHNAQGKTSVLEAVFFAATSKSHRTNIERDLVQHGADGFRVALWAERHDRGVSIEAAWQKGTKRFKVNGIPQTRISDILGRFRAVFFSPEDIELVKGGGATRRRFLDMEISQIHPSYLAALQQYRQVLRQRNELLRSHTPDPNLLAVWDAQLVQHGTVLIRERAAYLTQLGALAKQAYGHVATGESLDLVYAPDVKEPADLADTLERSRATDIQRRVTQHGPHRDDFEVCIDGRPARAFASQGQQKTAALAVKLAELELVKARTGEYPVLMLDEVLAELDEARSQHLFRAIDGEVQCILTTTGVDTRPRPFDGPCEHFRIQGGCLEKA